MTTTKSIIVAVCACLFLAVGIIGVGYALNITSTTEVTDNVLVDETIVLNPGGESAYSGSFNKEVEFHLGTKVVKGERTVVYTPCSWYMEDVQGKAYYNLGSIHLEVDTSASSLGEMTLNMRTTNPYTISQEFSYKVLADVNGHTYLNPFDMTDGSTFILSSSVATEAISKGIDLTLYMEAKTIDYLPSMILDGTVFVFTATVD